MHHIPKIVIRFSCGLLLLLAASLPLMAGGSREKEKNSKEVVATVNQSSIYREDLDREVLFMKQQFLQQGQVVEDSMVPQLQEESLDTLISRELLYQESRREGIEVDPSVVEENFESYRGQFPDEESFIGSLTDVQHTPQSFRADLERGLAVQKFVDDGIGASVTVPEADSRKFYIDNPGYFAQPEQVHARHILVLVEEGADEAVRQEALKEIKEVRAAVAKGGDFQKLAQEHSDDPGSGAQGGDLGWFGRGQMVPPFEEAAFALQPGQVSGVVETDYGYHIIQVIERRAEGSVPFEEVRGSIDDYLKRVRVLDEVNLLLDRLRGTAKIAKMLPSVAAPAQETKTE
jgi:peptidyl-prolyl cis-trans isomerase C